MAGRPGKQVLVIKESSDINIKAGFYHCCVAPGRAEAMLDREKRISDFIQYPVSTRILHLSVTLSLLILFTSQVPPLPITTAICLIATFVIESLYTCIVLR